MVAHNYAPDDLLRIVRQEAVSFRSRHPGHDLDDLMSVAGEAVAEALARLAPDMDPEKRWNLVKVTIRSRLKDFARAERVPGRKCSRLPADEDGNDLPVLDRRAADPADRAAAREIVLAAGAGKVVVRPGAGLPTPGEAAAKAAALREVMFASIRADHVRAMMAAIGEQAAGGDLKAAEFIRRVIAEPAPGPVQQTAVIVHGGDV
jgi:hypothetical protein